MDCNSRGLCEKCDADYTLCGHSASREDYGQCAPLIKYKDGKTSDEYVHNWLCGCNDCQQCAVPTGVFQSDGTTLVKHCGGTPADTATGA